MLHSIWITFLFELYFSYSFKVLSANEDELLLLPSLHLISHSTVKIFITIVIYLKVFWELFSFLLLGGWVSQIPARASANWAAIAEFLRPQYLQL